MMSPTEFLPTVPQSLRNEESRLLCVLHEHLASPITNASLAAMEQTLNELFELLPMHFDEMEAGGYLHIVVDEFPAWRDQVDSLRMEQALLYEDLRSLRRAIHEATPNAREMAATLEALTGWLDRFERHTQEEERLACLAVERRKQRNR